MTCKYFYLQDPVFRTGATFLVGSKKEMYATLCEKIIIHNKEHAKEAVLESSYMGKLAFFDSKDGVIFKIMLFDNRRADKSTVAHEIFHLVYHSLNDWGMKLSDDSEEAYAYLIGWYTKEFYKKIGDKNGRIQVL